MVHGSYSLYGGHVVRHALFCMYSYSEGRWHFDGGYIDFWNIFCVYGKFFVPLQPFFEVMSVLSIEGLMLICFKNCLREYEDSILHIGL